MGLIPSFPLVHFDFGAIKELAPELANRNIFKPLFLTDQGVVEHGVLKKITDVLPSGVTFAVFGEIPENPTIKGIDRALDIYKEHKCDGIVALGGGSVLDSGKALRVVTTQGGDVIDYLKDPDRIGTNVAPYITIPTTAGTGAEITFGGGIHPETNAPAMSIRSPHVKPDLAICDPELTISLPPHLTAATRMDAVTHCVEGYLSINANAPAEAIALDGIHRALSYIDRAVRDGADREARYNMSMAALEGGMAIYMGLGPIHSLSMAFGDSPLHHGTLVTVSMPAVMRYYDGKIDGKLNAIAHAMGLEGGLGVGERIAVLTENINSRLGLPSGVRKMGYSKNDIEVISGDALDSQFNMTAPIRPTREEYRKIIVEALG